MDTGKETGLPEHDDELLSQMKNSGQDQEELIAGLYLLAPKERVEQVECGSLHSLCRTN